MVQSLFIINYLAALIMLTVVCTDDIWEQIVMSYISGMDPVEQKNIVESSEAIRRIICWVLIVPGVGLAVGILNVYQLLRGDD